MENYIGCTVKQLPINELPAAAARAIAHNPANRPAVDFLGISGPLHLAVMTSKYWSNKGVKLTVGFLDGAPADLQVRILQHMNAWGAYANVTFALTSGQAQVRIARTPGDGYWSYLGVDILGIPQGQPTMNLEGFTMNTPESEFHRVVRHETGHTLGCPHEHMRREIVALLDVNKTIEYFGRTQGWSPTVVRQQVLTPVEESALIGTPHADTTSIMCYQLPGSITKNGQPIPGGLDIDSADAELISRVYPKAVNPPGGPPYKLFVGTTQIGLVDGYPTLLTAETAAHAWANTQGVSVAIKDVAGTLMETVFPAVTPPPPPSNGTFKFASYDKNGAVVYAATGTVTGP